MRSGTSHRAERPSAGSLLRRIRRRAGVRLPARQRGQALVEFALVAPLVLIIVTGILSFGVGLSYWLDMNRTANQGARQAVVNHWPPYCVRNSASCTNSTSSTPCSTVLAANSRARLQDVLRCQTRNDAAVSICYPGKAPASATIGDPVRVKLSAPYGFLFMKRLNITLTATAAMRLEQVPTLVTGGTGPTCT
jgi:hypothetical protein